MEVTLQRTDTLHERMPGVECAKCMDIEIEVGAICVGRVAATGPSAIYAIGLPWTIKAESELDDDTATIHVVRQVIADGIGIGEWAVAERHNDVVLLELRQARCAGPCVEQICSGNARFSQERRL